MSDVPLSDWLQLTLLLPPALGTLLIVAIFYWPGRLMLRFLSNGRYPPALDKDHNVELVAVVAFVALLLGLTFYYS